VTGDLAARALQQAGDGIIVIDTAGIIRVWSDHCVALFGHTAEQAIGREVSMIIPERLRAAHDRGFSAAMACGHLASDGKPRRTKGVRSDGESVYVTMTFAVVTDDVGATIGSVAVAREYVREG
jgi:PAS domain S-box-containing protein